MRRPPLLRDGGGGARAAGAVYGVCALAVRRGADGGDRAVEAEGRERGKEERAFFVCVSFLRRALASLSRCWGMWELGCLYAGRFIDWHTHPLHSNDFTVGWC